MALLQKDQGLSFNLKHSRAQIAKVTMERQHFSDDVIIFLKVARVMCVRIERHLRREHGKTSGHSFSLAHV